jgi:hypothetical protein
MACPHQTPAAQSSVNGRFSPVATSPLTAVGRLPSRNRRSPVAKFDAVSAAAHTSKSALAAGTVHRVIVGVANEFAFGACVRVGLVIPARIDA